ncbi:MAG: 50S ribosomal protein L15 [Pseudomonadota bacterium]
MKLNGISDNEGSSPRRKRVGRGIGSGIGKTGGRGVKGQKSRSGVAINGFEGGQMPIYRRLPKRGFSNAKFASKFNTVSIERLEQAVEAGKLDAGKTVDAAALREAGVIRRELDGVRVLGGSEAKSKFTLEVAHASASAKAAIEKAGGSVRVLAPAEAEAEA